MPARFCLQESDLLVHQAIALVDREQAAMILFDATVEALTLDMDGNAAIDVARQLAGALRVSGRPQIWGVPSEAAIAINIHGSAIKSPGTAVLD